MFGLRSIVIVLLFCLCGGIYAQGIRDSVFEIREFSKEADRIFKKEEAGMKETEVDTTVLQQMANLTLSELLSANTSVFIKSHGRGALATASFRGTAASHTQVTWNGISINSPMTGMVDFSLVPVYVIDDLNLKHGAASIADKSGGLGGSINISNDVNWDNRFSGKVMTGIGSYSTYDEFLQLNFGNKKIQSKTRLYYNYSANDYTFINHGIGNIDEETGEVTNPLDTNSNADYTRYGLLQEFYFRPTDKQVVSAKYWGQFADRTIPRATSYEGPDNSNLNEQQDVDHKAVIDWKYYGRKNKIALRSGYAGKQLDYALRNYVSGEGLVPAIYSQSSSNSFLNNVMYSQELPRYFSFEATVDGNYYNVESKDSVQKTGYTEDRRELSLFLSVSKTINERINLNIMARQDWIDGEWTPFVPYLGFDFRLLKNNNLIVKGNIGRNYHQPTLNDLYWQPGGNSELLPEDGYSFEMGVEYVKTFLEHHHLRTEVTGYYTDIDNWIIWIPSFKGYWQPMNIKRVLSRGVEVVAKLDGSFNKLNYKILGSYAYTSSINYGDLEVWGDQSYGKQLVYVPLHSGNVMVNFNYKHYFVTYQFNYYSERYTTSSNNVSQRDWLYPYFMNDLNIGKELKLKKITIVPEFKIYNLFNETYHSILYRPMPKRNYLFSVMFRF